MQIIPLPLKGDGLPKLKRPVWIGRKRRSRPVRRIRESRWVNGERVTRVYLEITAHSAGTRKTCPKCKRVDE